MPESAVRGSYSKQHVQRWTHSLDYKVGEGKVQVGWVTGSASGRTRHLVSQPSSLSCTRS